MTNPISFLGTIGGVNVRNLASLDKSVKFSVDVTEQEETALKVAQYLLYSATDQVFKITVEPIED